MPLGLIKGVISMKVAGLTLGKHVVVLLAKVITAGCTTDFQHAGPAFVADVMGYQL